MQRHIAEHRIGACPFVQILDALLPQMGDQVLELLQKIVTASLVEPVQVIAVPTISLDRFPQRSAVRRTQMAEQLVEVPNERGYALAVLASKFYSRRELRGSLSGQGSTASGSGLIEQNADIPVLRGRREGSGSLQGSRSRHGSAASIVEQNVDIPVPYGGGGRGGLQGSRPGQNSTAFCGADRNENPVPRSGGLHLPSAADGAFIEGSSHFSPKFKNTGLGSRSGSELPSKSSPSTWRTYAVPMVPDDDESATESESEVEEDGDLWVDGAGRQWMRTADFPGRWYLLGTGFDGSIWWDEPG